MVAGFIHDRAYQQRLTDILLNAVLRDMQDSEGRVILRSGDIFHVLTLLQAMMIADAPPVSSPTKAREFCQAHARELQRLIGQAQRGGGLPFPRMTIEGELH